MEKTLRTALIGLGRIGWGFHLPNIAKNPGFEPAAVVDTSPDRLAEAKQKYGVDGYADYREMLDAVKPELTVVCSPTHLHGLHAMAALQAGSDVFLDKPMAPTLAEAREIAACAQACGRKLMIYQPHRLFPEAQVARRILDSGVLGKLYMAKRANFNYMRRSDWQAFTKYGGGMLNNYGAHFIDQMLYLTGTKVTDITCHRKRILSLGDADDVVKVLLQGDDGLTVDIDIDQAAALPMLPMQLFGRYGAASLEDGPEGKVFRLRYVKPEELPPLEASDALIAQGRRYSQEGPLPWHEETIPVRPEDALDFYDAAYRFYALDEAPVVPVAETLRVMEIIDRCREQAPVV